MSESLGASDADSWAHWNRCIHCGKTWGCLCATTHRLREEKQAAEEAENNPHRVSPARKPDAR